MGKKNNVRSLWPILFGIVVAVGFGGCSSGPSSSSLGLLDAQGNHPAGWVTTHPAFARPDGGACTECHGSVTNEAQSGGIANVSCFTASRNGAGCHANGPAFHPLNWLNKAGGSFHGTAFTDNVLINGRGCTVCHDPSNPAEPPGFICLDCHFTIDGQRVPPGSAYVHGQITGHSAFLSDNAVNSVCQRCHETNNTFGQMPQPFCHNCHEPFPTSFHPTGWANPDAHGPSAKSAPGVASGFAFCQTCHANDFAGTGNAPSCLNNAFCHGSGVVSPHAPSPWRLSVRTHTNTDTGNADVCALCHLGGGSVVITPPTPVPGGVTPGCFNNTLCHGDVSGAPHAVRPFPDHPTRARNEFNSFCNSCHNINPPRLLASAPVCTECHAGGDPLAVANCASCHADPPDGLAPVGDVFPNIEGGHAEHIALDNVAGICDTCHNGGGTGTGLQHFYNSTVNVAFQNLLFKANSGNLLFTAADNTCSNVSCHGGIRTPNWRTGTIDVNTNAGCLQCHAFGTGESNSFNSGEHDKHVIEEGLQCRECHNMDLATPGAQNHFAFLGTTQMEGPASGTFQNSTGTVAYTPGSPGTGTCTGTCHGETHDNDDW
jgi:predicted CxxxxCH...CXXCH cytochrome family protein